MRPVHGPGSKAVAARLAGDAMGCLGAGRKGCALYDTRVKRAAQFSVMEA